MIPHCIYETLLQVYIYIYTRSLVRFMVLPMNQHHDNIFYCGSADNGSRNHLNGMNSFGH